MDRVEQERMLVSAMHELQAAQRQVVHLQQVVDGLKGLLYPRTETGSIELHPNLQRTLVAGHSDLEAVGARRAVEIVLQRNPNRMLTSRQIFQLVGDYGLSNPSLTSGQAAYDTAIRRLAAEPHSFVHRDEATSTFIYRPALFADSEGNESWDRVRGQMHSAELRDYERQLRQHRPNEGGRT